MSDIINLQISDELVKPIVDAKIQSAIVAALGNGEALIVAAVQRALNDKVGYDGKKAQYNSDNKFPYLETVCNRLLQDAVRDALKKWIEESRGKIEVAVKKELSKKMNSVAATLVDALSRGTTETVLSIKLDNKS
jgi:hypothetical protein